MAIDLISLRKLMQLMLASDKRRTSMLRADITSDLRREQTGPGGGGDFHTPFWADAKGHAADLTDLRRSTPERILAAPGRARLYPQLTAGFLTWWEERRRRRNEPFTVDDDHIRGRITLEGLGVVKVESTLGFSIGDDGHRVVYPYFCEEPEMTVEVARLGLWAMAQALPQYELNDLRILDVLRSSSYSTIESPMRGTEEEEFRALYQALTDRRQELRREY
ncbi:hypothetical protein JIX58_13265 [Brevundimonas diminuta]|uniref:hypothetical protein n=2 Tax=Caulobacteraceae TaxID=76892 RepID=UPI001904F78B|nr:hypothetical protein [Brevundimonas diminuta]MBK1969874.1 hypothetical protein [Brevundimonas diminuta]MBK1976717.1 hypothetical protein [Brevundimonas diminuta]MDA0744823.1 hypothetical protein [Pseudomonadota bacterium]